MEEAAPGRGWYAAAAAVALASVGAAAGLILWAVLSHDRGTQFLAPGGATIEADRAATYILWNDYRTVFEGRSYSESEDVPAGVRFSVLERSTGAALAPRARRGLSEKSGRAERNSIAEFSVERPGRYEIAARGEFAPRVFSVARSQLAQVFGAVFGAIAAFLAGLGGALWIFGWAYLKREAAREAAAREAAPTAAAAADDASLRRLAAIVYALQIAAFFFGVTAIAGVIVNYLKRGEARDSWLESHFRWQIRTFWWGLGWTLAGVALSFVVAGVFVLIGVAAWWLYRAIKGWIELSEGKPMYAA